MTSLADRLRDVVGRGANAPPHDHPRGETVTPQATEGIADTLGGEWHESLGHRCLVIDRAYGPGHRHGRMAVMDVLPPWPRLSLLRGKDETRIAPDNQQERLLFVDLETTGLAGGAGTLAFLVGCAWFDGALLRVRQLFLSSLASEPALLDAVARVAAGATAVVTFNGKSFDLPLIETRFLYHRMETPFTGVPHVDMLHAARRLWRVDDRDSPRHGDRVAATQAGCRLSALEMALCGVDREGDVPGFEIPSRYFAYVRTGDARPLAAVLEHNRRDLLSLALLTAHAARLLEEGPSAARTAREALGLGRLYERGGLIDDAREAFARAAGIEWSGQVVTRAEALRCCAVLCRRQRRFIDAALAWQQILELRDCPVRLVREATEALAIHHEHRLRDPQSARLFALQSLRCESSLSRQHAVRHRLARLERKLGDGATQLLQF